MPSSSQYQVIVPADRYALPTFVSTLCGQWAAAAGLTVVSEQVDGQFLSMPEIPG